MIKSLWERIGREVEKKTYTPRAVVHISANLDPGDIKLWGANESKVKFIASGSIPLKHPRKLKLCDDMEKAARELRSYLPVLLGIGVQCVIPKIVDEQLNAYDGLTKVEDDEREGTIYSFFTNLKHKFSSLYPYDLLLMVEVKEHLDEAAIAISWLIILFPIIHT